jgi:hypothetical protein
MRTAKSNLHELRRIMPHDAGCCVGRIVRTDEAGRPMVDFPQNPTGGPVAARTIIDRPAGIDDGAPISVVLLFENDDLSLPVIVGIARETFDAHASPRETTLAVAAVDEVIADRKVINFEAMQEIVLRCGKSSITMRADGTVVIKGTRLLSRSSGPNKIKGASVHIN